VLKARILTGALLTIIVLSAICLLPVFYFMLFFTAIILFAAWEWGIFIECEPKSWRRILYVCSHAVVLYLVWHLPIRLVLDVALLWWILAAFLILYYPRFSNVWSKGIWVRGTMGFLTLAPCWLAVNTIRTAQNGASILIFMLFLIWAADTGAFFVGRSFGAHPLLPKVSPKKTKEGLYGGALFTCLIAFFGALLLHVSPAHLFTVLLIGLILFVFSVIGDLFESVLKRQVGIKDTGSYLPGHGGLLDRIDSLTAAAPIFLWCLLVFGFLTVG